VRYDEESASLLIRQSTVPVGLTYNVRSIVPRLDAAELNATSGSLPSHILEHYRELPSDYPHRFRDLAAQVTAKAAPSYQKALALQNWFRANFVYDLNVPSGHGETAIDNFLSQRRGYCEQFAGTFAAFARSIGLPSRVAVGFTPGDLGSDGLYHVEGRHAHAWPEVYFSGIGWVAFEPTPGRGEPGAEGYTGVPAAQDGGAVATPNGSVPSTPTTSPTAPGAGARIENGNQELIAVPSLGGRLGRQSRTTGSASTLERLGLGLLVAAVLGLLALVGAALLRERRWQRRWATAPSPADQVLVTWQRTLDGLERAGLTVSPSDTPRQVAANVAPTLSEPDSLEELAESATAAAYSDHPDAADPARCETLRRTVQGAALERLPIPRRVVWRLRPS
jgi:hypothetical protein